MTAVAAIDIHAVSVEIGGVRELLTPNQALDLQLELIDATGKVAAANDAQRRHLEFQMAKERHHGRI